MGKFAYNYDYQALDDSPSPHFLNYGRLIDLIGTQALLFHLFNMHPETVKDLPHYKELYMRVQNLHNHIKEVIEKRRKELLAMTPEETKLQVDVLAKILTTENRAFEYSDEDIAVLQSSQCDLIVFVGGYGWLVLCWT
jgi:hypothetical protein